MKVASRRTKHSVTDESILVSGNNCPCCSLPTAHCSLIVREVKPFDMSGAARLFINIQNGGADSRLCC